MHDMSVAQMVAEEVTEKLAGKSPKSIEIEMDVGALRFHDTSQVDFWIKELLQKEFGRKLKVKTSIGTLDAKIKCGCGFRGKVYDVEADDELSHHGIYDMKCPSCGSDEYDLVQGNEVLLKRINVTE